MIEKRNIHKVQSIKKGKKTGCRQKESERKRKSETERQRDRKTEKKRILQRDAVGVRYWTQKETCKVNTLQK